MKIETLAAIDIGSNAIRLLISNVEINSQHPDFKKTAFLRVPIRLGEDVFRKGRIGDKKSSQLLNAMKGFSYILNAYGVSKYRACATSAMRDACNGMEIVEMILKEGDIKVEIITGQEEADIIFEAGNLDTLMSRNSNYLYVDVGGGSTEIVVYSNQQKVDSHSFQLGTVRMLEKAVAKDELKVFQKWLEKTYKKYAPLTVIASGGNINKVHKVLNKRENEPIIYPELQILYNTLAPMSYDERMRNYKLDTYRADVIIPALEIFLIICNTCIVRDIYVPKVGVVDGIIHNLYFNKFKKHP